MFACAVRCPEGQKRMDRGGEWWVLTVVLLLMLGTGPMEAQMKTGTEMKSYGEVLGLADGQRAQGIAAVLVESNVPGCLFYPGESPRFAIQIQNRREQAVSGPARFELIPYGTRGIPGDIWQPEMFRSGEPSLVHAVDLALDAGGWRNVEFAFDLPDANGGYALVLEIVGVGRVFVATMVRAVRPELPKVLYPQQSLDALDPSVLARMGVRAVRMEMPFVPLDHPQFAERWRGWEESFARFQEHGVTVLIWIGAGPYEQPLGRPRPHLNGRDEMLGGKMDHAWAPELDSAFREFIEKMLSSFGHPRGPVTAINLWNEPWEGSSISGWQADMPRYREIYTVLAEAVFSARKNAGVDVLVGGADSSSNTWDKYFSDGSDDFLPMLDFCSIHYQGMQAPVLYRKWNQRRHHKGRVLIWDTESWVANMEDRFAGVIATNRAAGYDRAMGIYGGNVTNWGHHSGQPRAQVFREDGTQVNRNVAIQSWAPAAGVAAVQHFLGERTFRDILHTNGLPWIYWFDGHDNRPHDATAVVIGDIGSLFGHTDTLFHQVRPLAEARRRAEAVRALRAGDNAGVAAVEEIFHRFDPFEGVTLRVEDPHGAFEVFDVVGNPLQPEHGVWTIPLDHRAYFFRLKPTQRGPLARLVDALWRDADPGGMRKALRAARVEGLQPVQIVARDFTARLEEGPGLEVEITNVLNRPVELSLDARMEGVELDGPSVLRLNAHATSLVRWRVTGGATSPHNLHPFTLLVDAGDDGLVAHAELMRVNRIAHRRIVVDGDLSDWQGVLPQPVSAAGAAVRTLTEAAWLPFVEGDTAEIQGSATGWVAYDEDAFYFAVRVVDDAPHPGTLRFATLDEDAFFYPEVSYSVVEGERLEHRWPEGVRRYSYRHDPVLPAGNSPHFDNVQLAFNVLAAEKKSWESHLPGRMPGFIWWQDTDYEYALNTVAEQFGGGFEVWRLRHPGMPQQHHYPRQPRHVLAGPVEGARMVTVHRDGVRITEAAIPWEEIPEAHKAMLEGRTIKFSFRVNNSAGGAELELGRRRSATRTGNLSFQVDWVRNWSNEIHFAFEPAPDASAAR